MRDKTEKGSARYGITARIVFCFVVLVIVPFFILAVVIAGGFFNYTISTVGENALDYVSNAGMQITDILKEYEEVSMDPYYNGYVEWLEDVERLTNGQKETISRNLTTACYSTKGIRAIYIVTKDGYFFGGKEYFTVFDIMEPYQEEIKDAGGACKWYSTNKIFGTEKENRYILARSLNSKEAKNVAYMYLVIDGNQIRQIFEQWKISDTDKYLVSSMGGIMYSSKEGKVNKTMDISMIEPNQLLSSQKVKSEGKEYLMVCRHMMYSDWYCIGMISVDKIRNSILKMESPFILIAGIYGVFMIVMLRMLKRYVFKPLHILNDAMDRYARESIGVEQIQCVGVGEFRSLSMHFNRMTGRIAGLMEDYRREEQEKNRQKMKALTSQLTPHFIYNALNTIKWMAVLNHQDNIRSLTESLIYIFMNAAKVDEENYTLKDELELIENYVVIQKARFMNFELLTEIQDECLECHIRKLLLQPIVENAIVHGLGRGKIKDGKILVKAWIEKQELYIEVKDNGTGFDVTKWRENPEKDIRHTNIGLHNVEEIITLEYKKPYELVIESEPGHGTTVKYHLPADRRKGKNDTDDNC